MSIQKISISPESSNYHDNDANIAYLYRGYYVWLKTWDYGSHRGDWCYAPAVLHEPDASLGEDYEPYWDNASGARVAECGSRSECISCIDRLHEQGLANPAPQPDPDAVKNVTLTVSLNEARTILAALSRRLDELDKLGWPDADTRATYQSIDQQAFHPCS